jgi:hypothetical protein
MLFPVDIGVLAPRNHLLSLGAFSSLLLVLARFRRDPVSTLPFRFSLLAQPLAFASIRSTINERKCREPQSPYTGKPGRQRHRPKVIHGGQSSARNGDPMTTRRTVIACQRSGRRSSVAPKHPPE